MVVSFLTNLTVEGVKKLLDSTTIRYSSNVLAAIIAVVISCGVSVGYMVMNDMPFTAKIGVQIAVLMYLGFLAATVGYDKIVQTIRQIQTAGEECSHE